MRKGSSIGIFFISLQVDLWVSLLSLLNNLDYDYISLRQDQPWLKYSTASGQTVTTTWKPCSTPIPLTDALEIKLMGVKFPSDVPWDLKITGNAVDCDEQKNLVVKAYNMLAADFKIPRIHTHLVKRIPSQAGMGGGSADAAYMIRLLDERFRLNIGIPEMERYAAKLGADCAYFISADPEPMEIPPAMLRVSAMY